MFLIFSSFQTTESIIMLPLDEDFLCLDFSCKGGGVQKSEWNHLSALSQGMDLGKQSFSMKTIYFISSTRVKYLHHRTSLMFLISLPGLQF